MACPALQFRTSSVRILLFIIGGNAILVFFGQAMPWNFMLSTFFTKFFGGLHNRN
jgi:hypothetical protein